MNKYLFTVFMAALVAFGPSFALAADTNIVTNKVKIGQKSTAAKQLVFDMNAGASNPLIRTNGTSGKLEFSNDGALFKAIGSGSGSSGGTSGLNLLANSPGFEDGVTNTTAWTNTVGGGTLSYITTGSNVLFDTTSVSYTSNSIGQYFTSQTYAIPAGLYGQSCLARVPYLGGDAGLKVQVTDGTNVLVQNGSNVEQALVPGQTIVRNNEIGFKCPSSGSLALRVISTAVTTNISYFDNMYLGSEDRYFRASQANFVGELKYLQTAGCSWSTATTSFANYAANASCPTPILGGAATLPAAGKIPGLTIPSAGAGEYLVMADSYFGAANGTPASIQNYTISDGTNVAGSATSQLISTNVYYPAEQVIGRFSYATAPGSLTFQLQGKTNSTSNGAFIDDSGQSNGFNMRVYFFPAQSSSLYVQTQAPTDLSFANDFSAQVSSTGVISNQSPNTWLSACTISGNTTCTIATGIFSGALPNCDVTMVDNDPSISSATYTLNTVTTTGFVIKESTSGTGFVAKNYSVTCHKSPNDYKYRSTILGTLANTVYGDGTPRTVGFSFITSNGTAACSIASTSNSGVTASGTTNGKCSIAFTGLFSSAPICTMTALDASGTPETNFQSVPSTSGFNAQTFGSATVSLLGSQTVFALCLGQR